MDVQCKLEKETFIMTLKYSLQLEILFSYFLLMNSNNTFLNHLMKKEIVHDERKKKRKRLMKIKTRPIYTMAFFVLFLIIFCLIVETKSWSEQKLKE